MTAFAWIDDLSREDGLSSLGTGWGLVTDGVMGGVSAGSLQRENLAGRPALRMRGKVSVENNGGFLQMALDLTPSGAPLDAGRWTGLELEVCGNAETYGLHLRTSDLSRPWQSYRQGFVAPPVWTVLRLPFDGFAPHRTDIPLNLGRLRRLGLVAIGRPFTADLALGGLRFYA